MEVNIAEAEAGAGGGSVRARLESWRRSVQYEPWYLKVSTLDRRLLWAAFISVFLLLLLIILVTVATGSAPAPAPAAYSDGRDYRGQLATTRSGLACVSWARLNRSVHTVTPDRFPHRGLGSHNYCRNPDLSAAAWCYTSLEQDHYDYCDVARVWGRTRQDPAPTLAPEPGELANVDAACEQNITVIVEDAPAISGLYVLSSLWANGRGVYVRVDFKTNRVRGDMCLSWHGRYRHWWIQSCSFIGVNGGVAWLEEDGKCPYHGLTWRRGGTNQLLAQTFATTSRCVEFGREYNGTVAGGRGSLADTQLTDTPTECQQLCWRRPGCAGFTWQKPPGHCVLFSDISGFKYNNDSVSGHATCRVKGMYRV